MRKVKLSQNSAVENKLTREQLNEIVGGQEVKVLQDITCPNGNNSITNCNGIVEYHDNWFGPDTITCSGQTAVLTKNC